MTEQQHADDLLAELLDLPEEHGGSMPMLSSRDEQALLHEAYQVGTPTLTPSPDVHERTSFAADLVGIVRRYPLPAVLAGAGLALVLTRRRR